MNSKPNIEPDYKLYRKWKIDCEENTIRIRKGFETDRINFHHRISFSFLDKCSSKKKVKHYYKPSNKIDVLQISNFNFSELNNSRKEIETYEQESIGVSFNGKELFNYLNTVNNKEFKVEQKYEDWIMSIIERYSYKENTDYTLDDLGEYYISTYRAETICKYLKGKEIKLDHKEKQQAKKINRDIANEIRFLYENDYSTIEAMSEEYNISERSIYKIIRYISYK